MQFSFILLNSFVEFLYIKTPFCSLHLQIPFVLWTMVLLNWITHLHCGNIHFVLWKGFHCLFSLPTDNRNTSGVHLSKGKKRPNVSSAFAIFDSITRSSAVDELQSAPGSSGSMQAPLCRPWDRGDLLRRLATFKSMTWFAKPQVWCLPLLIWLYIWIVILFDIFKLDITYWIWIT